MEPQSKANAIFRSVLRGTGITLLFLLVGTVLDYIVTQVLAQFFIANCSEDCYFKIFNSIFVVITLVSVVSGMLAGIRSYKRLFGQ